MCIPLLEDWLKALVATPGLTGITDLAEARRMLLEDSLRGVEVVSEYEGPIVDVGSGGGAGSRPAAEIRRTRTSRIGCRQAPPPPRRERATARLGPRRPPRARVEGETRVLARMAQPQLAA